LLATLAITLGVVFSFTTKTQQQTVVPVVHYADPPPAITNVVGAPTNVAVVFVGGKPAFPDTISVYLYTNRTYTNDETTTVAQLLGFTSPPIRRLYGKETQITWKSGVGALSFTTNAGVQSWSYGLFQSNTTVVPAQQLSDLARLFVEKNFFSGETVNLVLEQTMTTPIGHIQTTETPAPELRGYIFVNKTPNLYTIVSDRFDTGGISVVIDQNGVVRKLSFVSPPLVLQEQSRTIITIDEAIASINRGLGLLVSVTKNSDSYWEKTPQFSAVSLSDVQIVYYPIRETSLLVPFYLFKGSADTTEGVVAVTYAVSAIEGTN
jgi:hypothetical protein